MTDRSDGPALEPPYSDELLADLHSGALDDTLDDAARTKIKRDVDADPAARSLLGSLDAVQRDLRRLTVADDGAPAEPGAAGAIPPEVASRISAALRRAPLPSGDGPRDGRVTRDHDHDHDHDHSDAAHSDNVVPLRRRVWLGSAAAAIVAIVAICGVVLGVGQDHTSGDRAAHGPAIAAPAPRAAVDLGDHLTVRAALAFRGARPSGPFSDPVARAACLQANGLPPASVVLGSGPVTLHGALGTLLLLAGPHPPVLVAVVVGDQCGVDGKDLLAMQRIGG